MVEDLKFVINLVCVVLCIELVIILEVEMVLWLCDDLFVVLEFEGVLVGLINLVEDVFNDI